MKDSYTVSKRVLSGSAGNSEQLLLHAFARLHPVAFGMAIGTWFALAISSATVFLVLKGGSEVGPTLSLLSHYFPGYSVTGGGAGVGFAYGFVSGFFTGWLVALLRNSMVSIYLRFIRTRAVMSVLDDF